MNGAIDRLLGLDTLSTAGDGVRLAFARPMPAWGWALIVAALCGYALWTYLRLQGPAWARFSLAAMRALTLTLIALLIAGPHLSRQQERVERDWVVVMADRSASMTVRDGAGGAARDEQLRAALAGASPALKELAESRNLLTLGFDAGVYDLPGQPGEPVLPEASGRRTAIGASLAAVLRRVAARPLAGVVILSDGRSSDAVAKGTLAQLAERQVPVFVVPLGSPRAVPDMALARVQAPQAAFVGDTVPVHADVEWLGAGDATPSLDGRVQLVAPDGTVLDERPLADATSTGDGRTRVTLRARAGRPGDTQWTVRLVADGPDLSDENNALSVPIQLADRPIRVLYIDGYPRWEYRYLKNLLLRERSIKPAVLLLAAEKRYIQEGSERVESLPRTESDWAAFDSVVLGDLRPGLLSAEQLTALRDAVARRGTGLLWIGGGGFTPSAWRGTELDELIPFLGSADASSGLDTYSAPVTLSPGPAAGTYGLLQLADADGEWPAHLSDPDLGWTRLHWAQRIEPSLLKPAAEVIAFARADGEEPTPLVMTMRYGAGRAAYVGTDETWRLRYGRGETLPERFWVPLIRLLARGSLGRLGKPALLEATPTNPLVEQSVRISLKLLDQSLLVARPNTLTVRIGRADAAGANAQDVALTAEQGADLGGMAEFAGVWTPAEAGEFIITPTEAAFAGLDLATRVRVTLPSDELRRPQTDHESLAALAAATGGDVLAPENLSRVSELLPNREVRLLGTPQTESLWDKPIVLALLVGLFGLEWMGRRLIKLS